MIRYLGGVGSGESKLSYNDKILGGGRVMLWLSSVYAGDARHDVVYVLRHASVSTVYAVLLTTVNVEYEIPCFLKQAKRGKSGYDFGDRRLTM